MSKENNIEPWKDIAFLFRLDLTSLFYSLYLFSKVHDSFFFKEIANASYNLFLQHSVGKIW